MNHTTMYYFINELIEYLQEYKDSLAFPEYDLHQKGEYLAYLDGINILKEKSSDLIVSEDIELLKQVISLLQKKYNQTLDPQSNESKEDAEIRAGKHFGYYCILNSIDLYLIILFRFPRRLFDVIAPDLNNIDKKIDNTIIKPLPSRSELKEKLMLLLDNKINKEEIDTWARDWIIANPEAGKIEDGIAWEILNNLTLITYASDDSDLKDDLKEWLAELNK